MLQNMTEGEPLKLILPFMIPLLIGNVFQQLYNIADVVIVGRTIGVEALAAVGSDAAFYDDDGAHDWPVQWLYCGNRAALWCGRYGGHAPQYWHLHRA